MEEINVEKTKKYLILELKRGKVTTELKKLNVGFKKEVDGYISLSSINLKPSFFKEYSGASSSTLVHFLNNRIIKFEDWFHSEITVESKVVGFSPAPFANDFIVFLLLKEGL